MATIRIQNIYFRIMFNVFNIERCNELFYKLFHITIFFPQIINGIVRLSHFLVCFNSSANFLIYYVYGSKLRKTWVETYKQLWNNCVGIFKTSKPRNDSNTFDQKTPSRIAFKAKKSASDEFPISATNTLISIQDRRLKKFADFRATHGPTMV